MMQHGKRIFIKRLHLTWAWSAQCKTVAHSTALVHLVKNTDAVTAWYFSASGGPVKFVVHWYPEKSFRKCRTLLCCVVLCWGVTVSYQWSSYVVLKLCKQQQNTGQQNNITKQLSQKQIRILHLIFHCLTVKFCFVAWKILQVVLCHNK